MILLLRWMSMREGRQQTDTSILIVVVEVARHRVSHSLSLVARCLAHLACRPPSLSYHIAPCVYFLLLIADRSLSFGSIVVHG